MDPKLSNLSREAVDAINEFRSDEEFEVIMTKVIDFFIDNCSMNKENAYETLNFLGSLRNIKTLISHIRS